MSPLGSNFISRNESVSQPTPRTLQNGKYMYNNYTKKYQQRRSPDQKQLTQQTLRTKANDGMFWVGDSLVSTPEHNHTRLVLHNCNGGFRTNDTNFIKSKFATYVNKHCHFIALVETKINNSNAVQLSQVINAFDEVTNGGKLTCTNTPNYIPKGSQPGGVLHAVYGRLHQRLQKSGHDKFGRWTWSQFVGRHGTLRIYSLYRVNNNYDDQTGMTTAWAQQRKELLDHQIDVNPRKHVIINIMEELQKAMDDGVAVMLMADLNEPLDGYEHTNDKLQNIGLFNLMQHRIGDGLPATRTPGSHAIDHIWVSQSLLGHVHKAGYAPFNYFTHSDHRAIVLDIDFTQVLDRDLVSIKNSVERKLRTSIPTRMEAYTKYIQNQWEYHRIHQRIQELKLESVDDQSRDQFILTLNKLDAQMTEIMNSAEKKCTKVPTGSCIAWSPKLHEAIEQVRQCQYNVKCAKRIHINIVDEPTMTLAEAINELHKAEEKYRDIKKNAKDERKKHLQQLAAYYARDPTTKGIKAEIKRILSVEKQRQTATRINFALNRNNKVGINGILIPDVTEYTAAEQSEPDFNHMSVQRMWTKITKNNGKDISRWERITNKRIVNKLLLEWQCKHFLQATETPFASPQWRKELMQKQVQKQIITGTYQSKYPLPKVADEFLRYLRRDNKISKEIDTTLLLTDFEKFITKADEKTSCSPSGRTYAHYKTLLHLAPSVIRNIFDVMMLAIKNNIVLKRWCTTITTLIEKDAGQPKIHRMRAIHIVEAEMQFFSKSLYVQKMMKNVESLNLVSDEQYGGRAQRQAQSAVLNKVQYYDITRQLRTPSAFMDDDARACYDRIVTPLSAVEGRRWGMSFSEAKYTTNIIEHQQYHIRTATGVSSEYYSFSPTTPTQGAGQGLGWAGPKWLNTADTCSKILNDTCVGMKFEDPFRTINISKVADYFVDDTATGVNADAIEDDSDILKNLHDTEQKHAHVLFSAGHKLALDKCSFYLVDFHRSGTQYKYKRVRDYDGELCLNETFDHNPVRVHRLEPNMAHKTLGHFLAVDGNWNEHFARMMAKLRKWSNSIKSSALHGVDRIAAYHGYVEKSMQYMISSSSISYRKCQKLASVISPVLLNSFGIQRNCSRTVLYSTARQGGLNVTHPYHLQGLEKLRFYFMHTRRNDTTGKLLTISRRNTQFELGISQNFLSQSYRQYKKFVTRTWLTHLWSYTSKCNTTIHHTDDKLYTPPRLHDFFLMDAIFASQMSDDNKKRINLVRQKLQVLTASDIVLAGSRATLCPNILSGTNLRKSRCKWPRVGKLPKSWLELWKYTLQTIILPKLQSQPLGRWVRPGHQTWEYTTNVTKDFITHDCTTYFPNHHLRRPLYTRSSSFSRGTWVADVIKYDNDTYQCISNAYIPANDEQVVEERSLIESYENITDWRKRNWGVQNLTMDKILTLRRHLSNNNVSAACDGSVNGTKAAHAWCLFETDSGKIILQGQAPVDGLIENMTSTRTEIMSILAVLTFLAWYKKTYFKFSSQIVIHSDSASAIQLSEKGGMTSTKYAIQNDIDCVLEMKKYLKQHKNFILEHVPGHQDKKKDFDDLDTPAKLNILMDRAAGEFIKNMSRKTKNHDRAPILPSQRVCLLSRGRVVTAYTRETLIDNFYFPSRIKYLTKHLSLTTKNIPLINWRLIAKYLRTKSNKRGKFVKLMNNQLNTMTVNHRWDESLSDTCPVCHSTSETNNHVLRCKHTNIAQVRNDNILHLSRTLKEQCTHPDVIMAITNGINSWISDIPLPPRSISVDPFQMRLKNAIKQQSTIGWGNMLRGYVANEWSAIQGFHYRNIKCDQKFNIHRWENALIDSLLRISKRIWKERCDIVKVEDECTKDFRTRTTAFDLACKLRRESWKLSKPQQKMLLKPRKFFFTSHIDQITTWEQQIAKALKVTADKIRNTKSTLTEWITRPAQDITPLAQRPATRKKRSTSQQSLFTYLTAPQATRHQLPTIQEDGELELQPNPTGIERLFRKFNKYKRQQRTQLHISNNTTETRPRKYIQYRINRFFPTTTFNQTL